MPLRRSGIKALRVNKKNHLRNLRVKTELKKTLKKFQALAAQKDSPEAKSTLQLVYKKIDKAAKRNLLHKNTAARLKSRFSKLV